MSDSYEMPTVLTAIPEIDACYEIARYMMNYFLSELDRLEKEIYTDTAGETGISRRERMYKIKPNATDTLQERRFRIELYENILAILNYQSLVNAVRLMAGEDTRIERDLVNWTLDAKLNLSSQKMLNEIQILINQILPLTMRGSASVIYTRFSAYSGHKWSEFNTKTFKQLREEEK